MIITGSVALVTGGASGIGRAICDLLLQSGALVNFLDINKEKGEELERTFADAYGSGKAKFFCCDVTSNSQLEEHFTKIVKEHGGLNIVCNNAGILEERDWVKSIDVNLTAVIQGTLLGVEHMNKNGVIINTASTGGLHPISFCPVYCATKYGVVGFTRSIAAAALRKKGIRVNCVCPGGTDTDIFKAMITNEMTTEQEELATNTPKQTPEAVARAIIDLIKDERDNGQVLKVTYEEGVEYVNFADIVM